MLNKKLVPRRFIELSVESESVIRFLKVQLFLIIDIQDLTLSIYMIISHPITRIL